MYTDKSTAFFYSKKQNIILAKKIKDILNKFKITTINLQDIDDILLKKFSSISFLILDFTSETLDERSLELIKKLKEQKYIENKIVLSCDLNLTLNFSNVILCDDNFEINFCRCFKRFCAERFDKIKICETLWVKMASDFLLTSGFSMKHAGFYLLIDSIIYYMSKDCVIKNLSKDLYVYLANKYKVNISNIEMNIRKAISIASSKNGFFPFEYCPTNKEFITHSIIQLYDKFFEKKVISV